MGDENPIRTLGDYSKPSHKGYRNTIELPVGNNVVPLRSDTIRLVQNGCSFHGLQSEDPNQHLKDFLKLVDSLDLDVANRERTRTINQSAGGKLRDRNTKESWALLEDLALYDNESWNDPRDFSKPVKAIALPQDVPSTSDRSLIELKNQVQRLMEAHLALTQPTQVNKVTSSCKICSRGPTAQMNFTSTDYHTKEDLQSKGIKKNEAEEEGSVEPNKNEYTNHKKADGTDEEVESEKEVGEETEGETEKEEEDNPEHFDTFPTMKELRYHEWLLKNPRPPWVKAKIITGNVNNVKFSCMIGQFNKELEPKRKPSNPKKNGNFDTTSVIDHYLGSVVFGKPFMEAIGLVCNKEKGTVVFERDREKFVIFDEKKLGSS
ncbi:hypothetical protein Tco_0037745 [Tanacetum coccineum]